MIERSGSSYADGRVSATEWEHLAREELPEGNVDECRGCWDGEDEPLRWKLVIVMMDAR